MLGCSVRASGVPRTPPCCSIDRPLSLLRNLPTCADQCLINPPAYLCPCPIRPFAVHYLRLDVCAPPRGRASFMRPPLRLPLAACPRARQPSALSQPPSILLHLALPYTHLSSRTPHVHRVCLLRRTRPHLVLIPPRRVVMPPRRRFSLYLHTDRRIAREDRLRIISLLVFGMCEKGIKKLFRNIRWR